MLSQEQSEHLEKLVSGDEDPKSDVQKFCIEKIREYRGEYARINQILVETEQNAANARRQMQRLSDQADKYVDDLFEWEEKDEATVAAGNGEDKDSDLTVPASEPETIEADEKPST